MSLSTMGPPAPKTSTSLRSFKPITISTELPRVPKISIGSKPVIETADARGDEIHKSIDEGDNVATGQRRAHEGIDGVGHGCSVENVASKADVEVCDADGGAKA